jgi:hypothetical protein
MPLDKFRSLADAERSMWLEPGSSEIWTAARQRWALHCALRRSPPEEWRGVFRYRSIEEKQRADAG